MIDEIDPEETLTLISDIECELEELDEIIDEQVNAIQVMDLQREQSRLRLEKLQRKRQSREKKVAKLKKTLGDE
ncbi:MAG: hypothetical protein VKL39_24260 [Leptolyngbyaceae bacterium]|nr:hypothetical protein [Leptolyngbyaceae bacterium]